MIIISSITSCHFMSAVVGGMLCKSDKPSIIIIYYYCYYYYGTTTIVIVLIRILH